MNKGPGDSFFVPEEISAVPGNTTPSPVPFETTFLIKLRKFVENKSESKNIEFRSSRNPPSSSSDATMQRLASVARSVPAQLSIVARQGCRQRPSREGQGLIRDPELQPEILELNFGAPKKLILVVNPSMCSAINCEVIAGIRNRSRYRLHE